jgi:hypothetical protein
LVPLISAGSQSAYVSLRPLLHLSDSPNSIARLVKICFAAVNAGRSLYERLGAQDPAVRVRVGPIELLYARHAIDADREHGNRTPHDILPPPGCWVGDRDCGLPFLLTLS